MTPQEAKDQAAREWNSEFDFRALRNGVQVGNIKIIHLDSVIDRALEIYGQAQRTEGIKEGFEAVEKIRQAFADYVYSEGCSCCRDTEAHEKAENEIAALLNPEPYDDGSGYNWYLYKSKE